MKGCIDVDIKIIDSGISAKINNASDVDIDININKDVAKTNVILDIICKSFSVIYNLINKLFFSFIIKNDLSVSMGLVCDTGYKDQFGALKTLEGYVLTINGGYIDLIEE